ncbi:MAG: hypothetical protein R3A52_11795 [Polyangiales bacterium]
MPVSLVAGVSVVGLPVSLGCVASPPYDASAGGGSVALDEHPSDARRAITGTK